MIFSQRPLVFQVNAVDSQKNSPLHLAVDAGNVDVVTCLLTSNGDMNIQNGRQDTPLMRAICKENMTVVNLFLSLPGNSVYDYDLIMTWTLRLLACCRKLYIGHGIFGVQSKGAEQYTILCLNVKKYLYKCCKAL